MDSSGGSTVDRFVVADSRPIQAKRKSIIERDESTVHDVLPDKRVLAVGIVKDAVVSSLAGAAAAGRVQH